MSHEGISRYENLPGLYEQKAQQQGSSLDCKTYFKNSPVIAAK